MTSVSGRENKNGVLIHNGNKYAVGLLWLSGSPSFDRSLTNDRIKNAKGDFYCARSGTSAQTGIGWLNKGHKNDMPVAAIAVVDKLVGEWHGVFKADNGWWYLQVHSDSLAPRGDMLFFDEQEAKKAFQENASQHIWAHSYAPRSWGLDETREVTLDQILKHDLAKENTLKPNSLKAFTGSTAAAAALVLFVGALIGVVGVLALYLPELLSPKASIPVPVPQPQAVDILPKVEEAKEEVPELTELPERIKDPRRMVFFCGAAAAKIVQPVPGWPLESLSCTAQQAVATWKQEGGTLDMARGYAKSLPNDAVAVVDQRMMRVTVSIQDNTENPVKNFLTKDQGIYNMGNIFKNTGAVALNFVQGRLTSERPIPPVQPGQEPQPLPPIDPDGNYVADRAHLAFSIATGLSPQQIGGYFLLRGLELQKIDWNIPASEWIYAGRLYLGDKNE